MRKRALLAAGVLAGLALCLILVLFLGPDCLILKHTGFYCTGCGTQHMVLALLRGDLLAALRENAFMLVLLPLLCLFLAVEAVRYVLGRRLLSQGRAFFPALLFLLVLAGIFTVLRNLPWFTWLAPAWAVG